MDISAQKTYLFHIEGIRCKSCVAKIDRELRGISPDITEVQTNIGRHTVQVSGRFGDKPAAVVAEELTKVLAKHGYVLSVEKRVRAKDWSDFKIAIPAALAFVALFAILQKMGIVNLVGGAKGTYGTAFLVGVVASLSTCMAVVGGLVLSLSATFAKEGDAIRPQFLFHIGRIVAFFVLGGVIGVFGSVFALGVKTTFILGLFVGVVMLILGINLLDVFDFTKRLQPSMPSFITKHTGSVSTFNHKITPLLVGVATFFLPCGFTQSMQIYTLSTGSFLKGGLTMLSFALGTLPVLALISFSSFSIQNSSKAGVFFKTAGLVVIVFAVFNIINSFVVMGLIPPMFNF